jgi:hypothetical protein
VAERLKLVDEAASEDVGLLATAEVLGAELVVGPLLLEGVIGGD